MNHSKKTKTTSKSPPNVCTLSLPQASTSSSSRSPQLGRRRQSRRFNPLSKLDKYLNLDSHDHASFGQPRSLGRKGITADLVSSGSHCFDAMDSVYSPTDFGGMGVQGDITSAPAGPSAIQYDPASIRPFFVVSDAQHNTKPHRARRKSSSGSEQVKHRRTRSGCFTCRTRRVKVQLSNIRKADSKLTTSVRRDSPHMRT